MAEANAKGEVKVALANYDEPATLKYTFDDFADADELLGRSVIGELRGVENGDAQNFRMDTLRTLLYVGARPDVRFQSPQDVRGAISWENSAETTRAIMTAIYASFPGGEEEGEGNPTAGDGASPTSSS